MTIQITVGLGSCGIAAGGQKVLDNLLNAHQQLAPELKNRIQIDSTSCQGRCYAEVLVEIHTAETSEYYSNFSDSPAAAEEFLQYIASDYSPESTSGLKQVKFAQKLTGDDFLAPQQRIVLRNVGRTNPVSLEDYRANNGYQALEKILNQNLSPAEIIQTVSDSGLRGRGGAGFPTGLKWSLAARETSLAKYIICNGDEGDPGAFMDRSVLEGDPYSILEGMTICGYAIGAETGIIYVRAEYPLAVKNLRLAIEKAEAAGFLGQSIVGSNYSFSIKVKEGAGAFVCGEETALIASCEGRRGMPRVRPPFPAQSGLNGLPTNINNVETFANIPPIILNGAEFYHQYGSGKSRGTKVFALAGKVNRGGLIEVPMGTTLREVIFNIGGGIQGGKKFKAVQLGGPSGGCLPEELLDTPITYEDLAATGAIVGSGGMVVMDETSCMVDIARYFLSFTQDESCGKCTFCRIGTRRMLEILQRISRGLGQPDDLDLLEELAEKIRSTSLCGLGQTAPNPVLTTLRYFRDEYLSHIEQKSCPAGHCPELSIYLITDKCTGCGLCVKKCPTSVIQGQRREQHSINIEGCIKCGQCQRICPFNAIITVGAPLPATEISTLSQKGERP